ncbi:MAG: hypothetical protein AAGU11_11585, partial [Syntrophobacteraceae bacterium]
VGEIADLVESIYPSFVQLDSRVDRLEVRLWTSGVRGRDLADKLQADISAIYRELFMAFVNRKADQAQAREVAHRVNLVCAQAESAFGGL